MNFSNQDIICLTHDMICFIQENYSLDSTLEVSASTFQVLNQSALTENKKRLKDEKPAPAPIKKTLVTPKFTTKLEPKKVDNQEKTTKKIDLQIDVTSIEASTIQFEDIGAFFKTHFPQVNIYNSINLSFGSSDIQRDFGPRSPEDQRDKPKTQVINDRNVGLILIATPTSKEENLFLQNLKTAIELIKNVKVVLVSNIDQDKSKIATLQLEPLLNYMLDSNKKKILWEMIKETV